MGDETFSEKVCDGAGKRGLVFVEANGVKLTAAVLIVRRRLEVHARRIAGYPPCVPEFARIAARPRGLPYG
jgi:hypothetical protein